MRQQWNGNEKRLIVEIVRTQAELNKQTSKTTMKSFKIFDDNLAAITFLITRILWDKPTIVGATMLDLSKLHMYWFHYKFMKPNFKTLVLYSDTDSLIYEIESEDLYENLRENKQVYPEFDFSNYNENSQLFSKHQKLETLKFKDEVGGKIIHSIVALKSKLYSIASDCGQKVSAKGTTKYGQQKCTHDAFHRILAKETILRTLNYTINSEKHKLFTLKTTKISLSCFDDKRFIQFDGINTLPYGHYAIREDAVTREVLEDSDWGFESNAHEEEEPEDLPRSPNPIDFEPPDPGFNQDFLPDSELDNYLSSSENESVYNFSHPLILFEASDSEIARKKIKKR
ncbi:MAG: hypothetical protein AAFR83_21250 [Cyanobacteria bacterium J06629_18]